ncbi:MAG: hypothetical protein WAM28_09125 [Chlamydiales bacterium]
MKKEDCKASSMWASFRADMAKIRKEEVVHASALVTLAVLSAVTQPLWAGFVIAE